MPLTSTKVGQRAKLTTIKAGRKLKSKLADMGLIPGISLTVISKHPFIVAVKESRLALGQGMVLKIEVE